MEKREEREAIDVVARQLTLEEKIGMIHGAGLFETAPVERLHIPALKMSDGPMGVRAEFERDRWIAAGHGDDLVSYLPSNSAIAATWNRTLAREAGLVLGEEARGRGKDVILAPGINVKRLANCGRNFEYMSEDPYLIAELVAPLVEGIQSADVAACVKHFALNNQETERLWVNVEVDERTLREIYLPGFEAAVKAGAYSVMGAYNLIRGEHCCESGFLLDQILRREWGYDGCVISDWGGVHHTEAAGEHSLDIEMSVTADFDDYCMARPLLAAVREGRVSEASIDEKVRRILLLMLRVHKIALVEKDGVWTVERDASRKAGCYNTSAHRGSALRVAEESIVLLKNEGKVLPLDKKKAARVLVIGDNAVRRQAPGGGSAEIAALYEKTPLLGIREFLGGNSEVVFAQGYEVPEQEARDENWQATSLEGQDAQKRGVTPEQKERAKQLKEEALSLAAQDFDYVIFVGGLNHDYDLEGQDRDSLGLPYGQDDLIEALLSVRGDMVIVMLAGSPVSMERWIARAKSILWMSYCGMEGGFALAEILFGAVNPSGKLPESLPAKLEEMGGYTGEDYHGRPLVEEERKRMDAHLTQEYREGLLVGYRFYEKNGAPVQYLFGHGLSYTDFEYDLCRVAPESVYVVTGTLRNVGKRSGKEIVQVYVARKDASEGEPIKRLCGFTKLSLAPGERAAYRIELDPRTYSYYDVEGGEWRVMPGDYELLIGSSQADIQQGIPLTIATLKS